MTNKLPFLGPAYQNHIQEAQGRFHSIQAGSRCLEFWGCGGVRGDWFDFRVVCVMQSIEVGMFMQCLQGWYVLECLYDVGFLSGCQSVYARLSRRVGGSRVSTWGYESIHTPIPGAK